MLVDLLLIGTWVWIDLMLDKLDPVILSLDDFKIGVDLLDNLIGLRKLDGGRILRLGGH